MVLMKEVVEKNIADTKILVVGDIMVDEYIFGSVDRISPEAPVPVVFVDEYKTLLGGAGNVFNQIHSLGSEALLCGVVGPDKAGMGVIADMHNNYATNTKGIATERFRKTTKKTRVVSKKQHIVRIDDETLDEISPATHNELMKFINYSMTEVNGVILQDYSKGVLSRRLCETVIYKAKLNKKYVFCDPKGQDYDKYYGCTLFKPNLNEAEAFVGRKLITEDEVEVAARSLMEQLECQYVVITLGKEGMRGFSENDVVELGCVLPECIDVTGAGDVVISALAVGLSAGFTFEDACDFANHAAAISVQKVGTEAVTLDEVLKLRWNDVM